MPFCSGLLSYAAFSTRALAPNGCVFVGIGMEQGSVDCTENSSAGANSRSKGENSDRTENWRFGDLASGEAAISEERMEPLLDAQFANHRAILAPNCEIATSVR